MRRQDYDEAAVFAFRRYFRGRVIGKRDGMAVEAALARMREDEERIVRDVYGARGSESFKVRGELVRRCAVDRHYSISQVYYILAKARRLYAVEFGIDKRAK